MKCICGKRFGIGGGWGPAKRLQSGPVSNIRQIPAPKAASRIQFLLESKCETEPPTEKVLWHGNCSTFEQFTFDISLFTSPACGWDSSIPNPVTNLLTLETFYFLTSKSDPRDLKPETFHQMMRRHDLPNNVQITFYGQITIYSQITFYDDITFMAR